MTYLEVEKINEKILELWKHQSIDKRVPLFYPKLKKNVFLFIGLNPSFSKNAFKKILNKETNYKEIINKLDQFFSLNNFSKEKMKIFQGIAQLSRENYQYFTKFKEIARDIENNESNWEHIDLILMRQTNQKEIEKLMKNHNKFIEKQIDLNIKIMYLLKPELIIVENAYASKILHKRLNLEWDNSIGTYRLDKQTPLFFSGMLTGKRALDLGSYERLKWHLKFVKNYIT
jgi:tetratricopeptide (TPR) repeat protein